MSVNKRNGFTQKGTALFHLSLSSSWWYYWWYLSADHWSESLILQMRFSHRPRSSARDAHFRLHVTKQGR